MIATFSNLESSKEGGTKNGGRYLADAPTKFRLGFIILDDEFREVAMLAVDFTEVLYKRKFFSRSNHESIVLLNSSVNIEDTIFR